MIQIFNLANNMKQKYYCRSMVRKRYYCIFNTHNYLQNIFGRKIIYLMVYSKNIEKKIQVRRIHEIPDTVDLI